LVLAERPISARASSTFQLLEETHIKLSSFVSDLLGSSARRMLRAVATGETDPATIAALGSPRLRATPEQLCDALGAATDLHLPLPPAARDDPR
jgi:hypothetical protein